MQEEKRKDVMLDIATHSAILNHLTVVIGHIELAQRRLHPAHGDGSVFGLAKALHDLEEAEIAAWKVADAVRSLPVVELEDKPKEVA